MLKTSVQYGKPDAGKPHVRFDAGEVASAKPRRGALLYRKLVPLACLSAALCGCDDAARLVARTDYGVAAGWAPHKIAGREFTASFYAAQQSVDGHGYGNADPSWMLKVFRESFVEYCGTYQTNVVTKLVRNRKTREISFATNGTFKADYSFADLFSANTLVAFDECRKPFFVTIPWARPAFFLEKSYPDIDREGFRKWRAAHPEFIAFRVLGEFDSETREYLGQRKNAADPAVRAKINDGFPLGEGQYALMDLARESYRREKEMHFGSDEMWSLHSSCWSLAHVMADIGIKGIFYEATGQEYANWRHAAAYARGASRQWDIPFGWYTAHWYTGYTRNQFDKVTQGSNYWTGEATPPFKGVFCEPWRGLSRSLLDRQNFYGWIIGSSVLEVEDWIRLYRAPAEKGAKGFRPHEVAQDLERLYETTKTTDRGVPYTPCAILTPLTELMGPSALSVGREKHNLNAFFFTLVPVGSDDIMQRSLKKRGEQGCLFNSPFGDFWDVVTPDSGQSAADIAKALTSYKVAFLAGTYRKEDLKTDALVDYVKGGGTLVISSDRLADGLFPPEVAGVFFKTGTAASGKSLVCAKTGECVSALSAPHTWTLAGEGTTAEVLLTDDLGTPVVYTKKCGKGRVITVAAWRMMPSEFRDDYDRINSVDGKSNGRWGGVVIDCFAGRRPFDLIRALLERVQTEMLPVAVEGDVHWGLNKTKSGWLLWLMNNKGVIHYANEPEEFDFSKTARVKATSRFTGETYTADVKPGEWKLIEIKE